MIEAQVLIVGAGPVGMTLALDLAWRGIYVAIVETRAAREQPSVKCNHISARTMETFRRLGFADEMRDKRGLPYDYRNDVAFRTTVTGGWELSRIAIPCRRDRFTTTGGPDTWWPTPEPPHRINQIDIEPVMFDRLLAEPRITIFNRTRLESFDQDERGVTGHAVDLDTGADVTIRASWLVGCDGGRSMVRKAIGAAFEGDGKLFDVQSSYIRAPDLLGMMGDRPAWMTHTANSRRNGVAVAIDGRELWLIHNSLRPHESFDTVDRDEAMRTILGVDGDFSYELLANEDWTARRLIADKFRDRRAFIVGDAAQLWVPTAGYGMNAGIASATDLSWMLAGVLHGWADPAILDAYQAERHPINEQVSRYAMGVAVQSRADRAAIPQEIEADTPEGEAIRERTGQEFYELNVKQFCCGGLNFGYFYDKSPVIAYDGEPAPAYTMYDFTPSTVPGCRLPYFALPDGTPLYDALGPDFTLLRFDPAVDVAPLLEAAAARAVPMALVDIAPGAAPECYRERLVLSRPDRHVGWRGDTVPDDSLAVIDLLRGARR